MKMKLSQQEGFTLVELMITIAILGILAAIAIPNFLAYREKSQVAKAESDIESIELAVMDLALDTNRWPTGNIAGDAAAGNEIDNLNNPNAGIVANGGGWNGWIGPYLTEVPPDPWGRNYFFDEDYEIDGVDYVVIGSHGPNGSAINVYDEDNIITILQETLD